MKRSFLPSILLVMMVLGVRGVPHNKAHLPHPVAVSDRGSVGLWKLGASVGLLDALASRALGREFRAAGANQSGL